MFRKSDENGKDWEREGGGGSAEEDDDKKNGFKWAKYRPS